MCLLASSMIGTTTDRDGKFVLEGVPPGAHRLVITMLGYESAHVDTLFLGRETIRIRFSP